MTLQIDEMIDRRRMKRRLSLWRAAAIILAVVAIGAVVARFDTITPLRPPGPRQTSACNQMDQL